MLSRASDVCVVIESPRSGSIHCIDTSTTTVTWESIERLSPITTTTSWTIANTRQSIGQPTSSRQFRSTTDSPIDGRCWSPTTSTWNKPAPSFWELPATADALAWCCTPTSTPPYFANRTSRSWRKRRWIDSSETRSPLRWCGFDHWFDYFCCWHLVLRAWNKCTCTLERFKGRNVYVVKRSMRAGLATV